MHNVNEEQNSVRERILQAAVKSIDLGGEGAVRVVAVAKDAGVTQGMVSYYFQTRENLVAEAQAARFLATLNEDTGFFGSVVETVTTGAELRDALPRMLSFMFSDERRAMRAARIAAFGAATARPELMASIGAAHQNFLDGVHEVISRAQEKGLIVADLDARAVATIVTGTLLGLFVSDIDSARPADELMLATLYRLFEGFIVL